MRTDYTAKKAVVKLQDSQEKPDAPILQYRYNSSMDSHSPFIPGLRIGHAHDLDALTGCTVILCEQGAVGGLDQRG